MKTSHISGIALAPQKCLCATPPLHSSMDSTSERPNLQAKRALLTLFVQHSAQYGLNLGPSSKKQLLTTAIIITQIWIEAAWSCHGPNCQQQNNRVSCVQWCSSPVSGAAGVVLLDAVWHVLADTHFSRLSPAKFWVRAAVALVEAPDSSSPPQHGACFFSTLQGCDKPLQGALNHCMEDA